MDVTQALASAIDLLRRIEREGDASSVWLDFDGRLAAYEAALEAERGRRDLDARNRAQLRSLSAARRALKEHFGGA